MQTLREHELELLIKELIGYAVFSDPNMYGRDQYSCTFCHAVSWDGTEESYQNFEHDPDCLTIRANDLLTRAVE